MEFQGKNLFKLDLIYNMNILIRYFIRQIRKLIAIKTLYDFFTFKESYQTEVMKVALKQKKNRGFQGSSSEKGINQFIY